MSPNLSLSWGAAILAGSLGLAGAASAASVEISVTNNQSAGGLYLTPVFAALHDGTFDPFNAGSPASGTVEALAEGGVITGLAADAGTNPNGFVGNGAGFGGAPVLDPGETGTLVLDADAGVHRFLTFMSMVIPSNDAFIGNDSPMAYEVFDAAGTFKGLGDILIYVSDVWDGGTEANNNQGAAFNTAMGTATDTTDVITQLANLDFLLGQETVAGTTVTGGTSGSTLLATITLRELAPIPVPAALPLMVGALGVFGLLRRRRTKG